ncbi:uncharacterized protein LJ206_014447 isoform 2-T6 [Theristicus caerulescens]
MTQHNFRNAEHLEMMVHHPSSSPEISAVDAVGAVVQASQTTLSRTEAATEEETLTSLVDILQQVTRNVPTQGTPAQPSAVTPTPNDTIAALWLKVYRKHAKKQKKPRKRRNDKKTYSIYTTIGFDTPN